MPLGGVFNGAVRQIVEKQCERSFSTASETVRTNLKLGICPRKQYVKDDRYCDSEL